MYKMTPRVKNSLGVSMSILVVVWLVLSIGWWIDNIKVYNGYESSWIGIGEIVAYLLVPAAFAFVLFFVLDDGY